MERVPPKTFPDSIIGCVLVSSLPDYDATEPNLEPLLLIPVLPMPLSGLRSGFRQPVVLDRIMRS